MMNAESVAASKKDMVLKLSEKEEAIERIYHVATSGYKYLFEAGKKLGHWEEARSTALAAIALDLREPGDSTWLKVVRQRLEQTQILTGDATGSWGEEIWDTAMCIIALKSLEVSSKDPVIRQSVEWILSLYQVNRRNNWHDEPWETCWALMAILTCGLKTEQLNIGDALDWLLDFQDEQGQIIAPHYTAYYLLIYEKLNKVELPEDRMHRYEACFNHAASFLLTALKDSAPETLWSGEAWSNGQILWALCKTEKFPLQQHELLDKTLHWFEYHQGKAGNWSDIEDTSSALIGLYFLLFNLTRLDNPTKNRDIKIVLQKKLPTPALYIKRPFIEKHPDTGGVSININSRVIKFVALLGVLLTAAATIAQLLEFIFKK